VARFAGADEPEKVNRTVYQAFLTSVLLVVFVMAPIGWVLSPVLLDLVNATPEVQAEALPYLRTMFVFSFGMLMFFMLGGALRSAGDAQTPLRLGVVLTVLNIVLNVILIRGLGPIPAFGTLGARPSGRSARRWGRSSRARSSACMPWSVSSPVPGSSCSTAAWGGVRTGRSFASCSASVSPRGSRASP
jgi:hypothetical protein